MPAKIPIMATVIINSIKVKPEDRFTVYMVAPLYKVIEWMQI